MHKRKWQLYSIFALTILVILAISIVYIILKNIIFALYLLIAFIIFVYAGWLVFSGLGRRLRLGKLLLAVTIILFIVAIFFFVNKDYKFSGLIALVLLAITYLWIIARLRNEYWQEMRAKGKNNDSAQYSKPYLIINPKSGNGRAIKAHIEELAIKKNINVIVTKKGQQIETITRKVIKNGADIIGISGGDGSIGAVAKVALEYDIPIVVLPGGTRCHFAKDLGLDPKKIVDSLESFSGVERRVDVGVINNRIFLNNASFGLYADIVSHENYRGNKLEVSREVIKSIANGKQKPYDLFFSSKSKKYKNAIQVLVGVNAYNTVNILELGQRSNLDGGVLQITALSDLNDDIVKTLIKPVSVNKLSKLKKMGVFEQWETTVFNIKNNNQQILVGVDGENESFNNPVVIKIKPKALRILVPAEGTKSRPKNAVSVIVINKLWQLAIGKTI